MVQKIYGCQPIFLAVILNINIATNKVIASANNREFNITNTRTSSEDSSNISSINKGVIAIIFLAAVFGVVIGVLVVRFCCIRRSNVRGMESRALRMNYLGHRTLETEFSDLERITAAEKIRVDKICTPRYPNN